jgi:hypothetical protein
MEMDTGSLELYPVTREIPAATERIFLVLG